MHLYTRNVNTAFRELVKVFDSNGMENGRGNNLDPGVVIVRRPSRNGNVLMIDEPVTVTYTHPKERILFNAARDANPFFGLYEQLWMLAGRNDVTPLAYYTKQMTEYSDDGTTLNGSYGHRWRHSMVFCPRDDQPPNTVDQLDVIVNHLKADPNSRRVVLQMWNVEDDLLKIGAPTPGTPMTGWSKDVCCLAGETTFRSPEGDMTIADLSKKFHTQPGYRYPVYTIDPITGDQRLSWMTAAWKTGIKKTIVLKLDDGSSVRLTTNHVVYRKRKTFEGKRCTGIAVSECEAGDLRVGDSLLSELAEDSVSRLANDGYRQFKRNVFKNTSGKNMIREHREYYEFATGEQLGANDVHHINEDGLDNRLENLESLSVVEHQRRHKLGDNNPHCKMSKEDKARRGRIHSAVLQSGGKENTPANIRDILKVRPPHRTDEQNEVLWEWVCTLSNHKIVSIEDGGYTTVYDFTVPGRHNAVLSNGVLVHNCNLSVMFSLREQVWDGWKAKTDLRHEHYVRTERFLDMTVTNRSNDMIWGMLGQDYLTFSILQEYMAARIGVEVGKYHHFTNNLHVYEWNWKPEEWLAEEAKTLNGYQSVRFLGVEDPDMFKSIPLVKDPEVFDKEVKILVESYHGDPNRRTKMHDYKEPFFRDVAEPMFQAFAVHKSHNETDRAISIAREIKADDWRIACTTWLQRRVKV